jgi:peptidylprolyl isomerase
MRAAKKSDKVHVHYKGSLTDGTVFDSSFEREPLEVNIGAGELIAGFENALLGMAEGQTKTVELSPQDAYGEHLKELVKLVDRKYFPKDLEPQEGMQLQLGEHEERTIVTLTSVTPEHITLDANHPLAGKTLNFEIQLVKIL